MRLSYLRLDSVFEQLPHLLHTDTIGGAILRTKSQNSLNKINISIDFIIENIFYLPIATNVVFFFHNSKLRIQNVFNRNVTHKKLVEKSYPLLEKYLTSKNYYYHRHHHYCLKIIFHTKKQKQKILC